MLPKTIMQMADDGFSDFLFYDCEVFAYENLAVFKDIAKNTVAIVRNNDVVFGDYGTVRELVSGKILVGYNNYSYDDYIISAMIAGCDPKFIKSVNDMIIAGMKPYIPVNSVICSLDCFQQIKYKSGLKKVEANLGQSIDETAVDFNLDRLMTYDELQSTVNYCSRDVDATVDVFKLRWEEYFKPKLSVVAMLPPTQQERFMRYNTTTITAQLLTGGKKSNMWAGLRFGKGVNTGDFDTELFASVPREVLDMWSGKTGASKCVVYDMGCEFTFKLGGLHGTNLTGKVYRERPDEKIMLLDVASMYPNIILNIDGLGPEGTKVYKRIVERRMAVKHSDPVEATALKLVINSAYGLLKSEYSKLYNPKAAESVCLYGQSAIYDLCRRLYDLGYEIIQANTDGVCFYGKPTGYETAQREWEELYGLTLELSTFTQWIQRDVNNYVAVKPNGGIKVKGGDVNKYNDPTDFGGELMGAIGGEAWAGNNSNAIVSRAIVDALVYGKPTEATIYENMDKPLLYQIVLQAGKTYRGVVDTNGNRGYQKVNRVFATRQGTRLLKETMDGLTHEFPDMPESMYVCNGDLKTEFDRTQLDLDYYNALARRKLSNWPNPLTV